jgi:uncharacterized protein
MASDPHFFPGPSGPLYGVFHPGAAKPPLVVLFLPPLFEEKKPSYRPLHDLAEALAARGAAVLRFDYRGTGDSSGIFRDLIVAAMRQDAAAAAAHLRTRAPEAPLALVGLRIGAALALQEAASLAADRVVALAPILKGKRFVTETVHKKQVRGMLTSGAAGGAPAAGGEEAIDLDGFETSPRLLAELEAIDLAATPPKPAARTLLIDIGARAEPSDAAQSLAAALGPGAEARAFKAEPFWNLTDEVKLPELQEIVAGWLMGAGG